MIYFLECEGRIKVGYSRNPDERVKELATGAPGKLAFLGHVEGPRRLEAQIHRCLRNFRVSGEWFRDCPEVRGVMHEALAGTFRETASNFAYPELIAALKKISEPFTLGMKVKDAIDRAAAATGLPRWRTFDIWYGKARFVDVQEAIAIRDALIIAVK